MDCLESDFAFRGMLSILFLACVKFVNVTESFEIRSHAQTQIKHPTNFE